MVGFIPPLNVQRFQLFAQDGSAACSQLPPRDSTFILDIAMGEANDAEYLSVMHVRDYIVGHYSAGAIRSLQCTREAVLRTALSLLPDRPIRSSGRRVSAAGGLLGRLRCPTGFACNRPQTLYERHPLVAALERIWSACYEGRRQVEVVGGGRAAPRRGKPVPSRTKKGR